MDIVQGWEFVNKIPTTEETKRLLGTLSDWWGVRPEAYSDYVQALPQDKKIKVPKEPGSTTKVDQYIPVYTLYFSVGGRQQMMRDAQQKHWWRVDYEPEPCVPNGNPPGFLEFKDRLVYREYVSVWAPIGKPTVLSDDPQGGKLVVNDYVLLGRKPGTAWVPRSGGKNAAQSNPWEKVETSARGRALAAWGFGVLPGSGVASLEEMQNVVGNLAAAKGEGGQVIGGGQVDREELESSVLLLTEQIRARAGQPENAGLARLAQYLQSKFQKDVTVGERDAEGHPTVVDLSKLKPGELVATRDRLQGTLNEMIAAEGGDSE